ncbi:MAG: ABC transporter ATP-binding protein [Vagococcus sp.]|uniref:ABC transporter ATP-binding protein n=1 Tax=Vagococcus sp. TaxID=1933889 RepID=UPI002FC8014F
MKYEIKHLGVTLNKKEILKDISLSLPKNQFIGIIGPNGSGKSTLLKTLYKGIKEYSGNIVFLEKDLASWKTKDIAKENAVVAQLNEVNFNFTVLDIVLMGREPHKEWWQMNTTEDLALALDSLDKVGMVHFKDEYFSFLSGGEKQRVILARALAQKANCLILDEPTNHLDVKNQLEFLSLVRDLNLTIISVIHDLNLAANYCDILYVMKDGQIVLSGIPTTVLTTTNIKEIFEVDSYVKKIDNQIQISYKII